MKHQARLANPQLLGTGGPTRRDEEGHDGGKITVGRKTKKRKEGHGEEVRPQGGKLIMRSGEKENQEMQQKDHGKGDGRGPRREIGKGRTLQRKKTWGGKKGGRTREY